VNAVDFNVASSELLDHDVVGQARVLEGCGSRHVLEVLERARDVTLTAKRLGDVGLGDGGGGRWFAVARGEHEGDWRFAMF